MSGLLKAGQKRLAEKLTKHASREITYRRGEVESTVTATIGKTMADQDTGDGLVLRMEIRDYLIERTRRITVILCPQVDGEMRHFMGWVRGTHTTRYHAHWGSLGVGFVNPNPNRRFYPLGQCPAFPDGSGVSTSHFRRKSYRRSDYHGSVVGHLGMKLGWSQSHVVSIPNPRCALDDYLRLSQSS